MADTPEPDPAEVNIQMGDILNRIQQIDPNLFHRAVAEVRSEMLAQKLRAAQPEGDV